MTVAYPLAWPQGMPRTAQRVKSQLSTSVNQAVNNVLAELRRFGKDSSVEVESIVISSNVSLTDARPADPGVACYFRWDNIDCCIAIDRYLKPEENLQAIFRIIEAERTKLRHGGLNIVRQGFRGFAALPPPTGPSGQLAEPWWATLGFTKAVTLSQAEAKYRNLVKEAHPDTNKAPDAAAKFNALTDAIRQARNELGRGQ